jgi:chromosome segregation ATPase
MEKELKKKLTAINRIAWRIRQKKSIRKIFIKCKELQKQSMHWGKLHVRAITKIVEVKKIAQKSIDALKESNMSSAKLKDEMESLIVENASITKNLQNSSAQVIALRKTNNQLSEKLKSRIKDLKVKNTDLEHSIKKKSVLQQQIEEGHRKTIKQFEKDRTLWNEKADRFEHDRNKWRNYFQQATKEMKSLKKENKKVKKIIDKLQLKEKEENVPDENVPIKIEESTPANSESKVDFDSFMCSICFDSFFEENVRPKALQCGHVYCSTCVETNIFKEKTEKVPCPNCRSLCDEPMTKILYFS